MVPRCLHTGAVLVLHGNCTGNTLVVNWYCGGARLVPYWPCAGTAQMLHWCCTQVHPNPRSHARSVGRHAMATSTARSTRNAHPRAALPMLTQSQSSPLDRLREPVDLAAGDSKPSRTAPNVHARPTPHISAPTRHRALPRASPLDICSVLFPLSPRAVATFVQHVRRIPRKWDWIGFWRHNTKVKPTLPPTREPTLRNMLATLRFRKGR